MYNQDENLIFKSFLIRERQGRYIALLAAPHKRQKLLNRLADGLELDPRYARLVGPTDQNPERLERIFMEMGAGTKCHIISENPLLDGRVLELRDALQQVVGYGYGTILSCIPGRLAYYEAERCGARYILQRTDFHVSD